MQVFTPDQSGAILRAMADIEAGNNGWAFVPDDDAVHAGLQAAGYTVIASRDWHGMPAFKGYTRRAQEALRGAAYAVSTYKTIPARHEEPDYEAAILARQEAADW